MTLFCRAFFFRIVSFINIFLIILVFFLSYKNINKSHKSYYTSKISCEYFLKAKTLQTDKYPTACCVYEDTLNNSINYPRLCKDQILSGYVLNEINLSNKESWISHVEQPILEQNKIYPLQTYLIYALSRLDLIKSHSADFDSSMVLKLFLFIPGLISILLIIFVQTSYIFRATNVRYSLVIALFVTLLLELSLLFFRRGQGTYLIDSSLAAFKSSGDLGQSIANFLVESLKGIFGSVTTNSIYGIEARNISTLVYSILLIFLFANIRKLNIYIYLLFIPILIHLLNGIFLFALTFIFLKFTRRSLSWTPVLFILALILLQSIPIYFSFYLLPFWSLLLGRAIYIKIIENSNQDEIKITSKSQQVKLFALFLNYSITAYILLSTISFVYLSLRIDYNFSNYWFNAIAREISGRFIIFIRFYGFFYIILIILRKLETLEHQRNLRQDA